MDLAASLFSFLQTIAASSVILLNLLLGSGASLFSMFVISESPLAQTQIATTTSITATTTPVAKTASSTPKKVAAKPTKVAAPVSTTVPTPQVAVNLTPLVNPETLNTETRTKIVNILCSVSLGKGGRSISGSGVLVDARGVVLTNAHIGQYFLLSQALGRGAVDCVIRTGSPATPLYRATLLYLPPQWVENNASQLTAEHALGTGEYDYAFLLINETTNPNAALPSSFPNIQMSGASPQTGENILVAGYPAGFLDSMTIERNLYATSAFSKVGQLYTFDSNSFVDVIALGGTVVAQGGSSGGAVVRLYDGKLSGLIATATTGTTTADRDLHAITLNYIDRSLTLNGKGGIVGLLTGDIKEAAAKFNTEVAPGEAAKLQSALK
jgi:hypothetical protein